MKIIIDELITDQRLDTYLVEALKNTSEQDTFSRSQIQKLIKEGNVRINNKIAKPSYILKPNDIIEIVDLESEVLSIQPENIPIQIIWEDKNLAIINKPSGMLTHPTTIEKNGTLVNALLNIYDDNLSNINGEFRRGILHRLDRNTSGLLIIAKNNKIHEIIANMIKNREITKKYLAIVKGNIEEDFFEINKPIGRNPNQPHKMCILEDGKESISRIKVLKRLNDATLVEIHLVTGRTHQIRVHMSSIGHPVFNDTLYGFGKIKINTEEQVLQSYKLEFVHPITKENMLFEIEPDEKIKKVLKCLS